MSASTEPTVPEVTPEEYDRRRKLLTDALRSGEFEQAQYRLRQIDEKQRVVGHCCLGVACEIFRQETHEGTWDPNYSNQASFRVEGEHDRVADLPTAVQNWYGFSSPLGTFETRSCLTDLNDRGTPFLDIADIIDSKPKGLFSK